MSAPHHEEGGTPPGAGPSVEGFLDYVDGERVVGWAYDPASPARRLLVEIVAGSSSSLVLANAERRDLRDAGKGDGRHGFVAILGGDRDANEVSARIAATGQELNGSPYRTGLAAALAHPAKRPALEAFASELQLARLALTGPRKP